MYQPWIFGSALVGGAGLVALTVQLQKPPAPPAAPEPATMDAVRVVPPPAVIAEPAPESVLELEPVVIEGRIPASRAPTHAEPVSAPIERPCSAWRDLGPTHVALAKSDNEMRVRELCQ